jgi:hypothetical protein
MPTITADTPRTAITIAGKEHTVYAPYAEGHVLTPNEAASLNQTYAENIRNNQAKAVKAHVVAGSYDPTATQAAIDDYMSKYEFGARVSSGPREGGGDPVMARAVELAREVVRRKIREAGGNPKDYAAKEITERAKKAVETNPKFKEMAATQLQQESKLGDDTSGLDSAPTVAKVVKAKKAPAEAEVVEA